MTPEEGRTVWTRKKPPDEEGVTWNPIHDEWKTDRIVGWYAVVVGIPDDFPEPDQLDRPEPRKTGLDRSLPTADK